MVQWKPMKCGEKSNFWLIDHCGVVSFAAIPARVTQSGGALRDSSPSSYEGD